MSEYILRNLTSSFLPKLSSTNKKKQQVNVMSSNKALLPTTLTYFATVGLLFLHTGRRSN